MDIINSQEQTEKTEDIDQRKLMTPEEKEEMRKKRAAEAQAEKMARNKATFLQLFQRVMIASAVMEKMDMSPKTYYDWMTNDQEFRNAVRDTEAIRHASVEDRLFKLITQDDAPSIRFYLERRDPKYKAKSINEIGPVGFKSLEELIADARKKRDEQIAEQIKADGQQGDNPGDVPDTKQVGIDSAISVQPSTEPLLETKDTPKPDTQSTTGGD